MPTVPAAPAARNPYGRKEHLAIIGGAFVTAIALVTLGVLAAVPEVRSDAAMVGSAAIAAIGALFSFHQVQRGATDRAQIGAAGATDRAIVGSAGATDRAIIDAAAGAGAAGGGQ